MVDNCLKPLEDIRLQAFQNHFPLTKHFRTPTHSFLLYCVSSIFFTLTLISVMGPICGATFGAVFGAIYSPTFGSNLLPFLGLFTNELIT